MIKNEEIKKLLNNAGTIAMMMSDDEIEKIIVYFVEEKLARDKPRNSRWEKKSSHRPR